MDSGLGAAIKISFLKISDLEHELAIERPNGSNEKVRCETRSYLFHDLTHLAFEIEANLQCGFWGQIANGKSFADLSNREAIAKLIARSSETLLIEKTVAILQGLAKGKDGKSIVQSVQQQPGNFIGMPPEWFTLDFVDRVDRRLKKYLGQWRSTLHGHTME